MAPDPRDAWVAMPPLHLPPRRRQALGAGKARKAGLWPPQTLLENAALLNHRGLCPHHSGLFRSSRRYLSPERLASVRREDPRSRTTSSSSNCSAKKEG